MRVCVRKRYAELITLTAIANGEAMPSISMPKIGTRFEDLGWSTYTPTETLVGQIRDALRSLANAGVPKKGEQLTRITLAAPPSVAVTIASDGIIEGRGDFIREKFLPALEHCDVRRIRMCPICDKLFVALRLDQPACSRKCDNAHRARKFRRKYESNRRRYRKRGIRAKELTKLSATLRSIEKHQKRGK